MRAVRQLQMPSRCGDADACHRHFGRPEGPTSGARTPSSRSSSSNSSSVLLSPLDFGGSKPQAVSPQGWPTGGRHQPSVLSAPVRNRGRAPLSAALPSTESPQQERPRSTIEKWSEEPQEIVSECSNDNQPLNIAGCGFAEVRTSTSSTASSGSSSGSGGCGGRGAAAGTSALHHSSDLPDFDVHCGSGTEESSVPSTFEMQLLRREGFHPAAVGFLGKAVRFSDRVEARSATSHDLAPSSSGNTSPFADQAWRFKRAFAVAQGSTESDCIVSVLRPSAIVSGGGGGGCGSVNAVSSAGCGDRRPPSCTSPGRGSQLSQVLEPPSPGSFTLDSAQIPRPPRAAVGGACNGGEALAESPAILSLAL